MVRLSPVARAVVVSGDLALTPAPAAAQRAGPGLQQVLGCTVGTLADFPYSETLKQADFAWTYMMYRQTDRENRSAIIRYLRIAAGATAQQ